MNYLIRFGLSPEKIPAASFEEVRKIVNRRAANGRRVVGRVSRADTGFVMAEFWAGAGHRARFHRLDAW